MRQPGRRLSRLFPCVTVLEEGGQSCLIRAGDDFYPALPRTQLQSVVSVVASILYAPGERMEGSSYSVRHWPN